MIEYVMLIVIVISMSSVVYLWLRGYAPTNEEIECNNGVSIYISNVNCTKDKNNYTIHLTIKNTGKFNLRGFYIRGTNDTNQQLAAIDLSKKAIIGQSQKSGNEILFNSSLAHAFTNSFSPQNEMSFTFITDEKIQKIEITPTRIEKINDRDMLASCQKAIVSEKDICL